jgi:hypothetical protein
VQRQPCSTAPPKPRVCASRIRRCSGGQAAGSTRHSSARTAQDVRAVPTRAGIQGQRHALVLRDDRALAATVEVAGKVGLFFFFFFFFFAIFLFFYFQSFFVKSMLRTSNISFGNQLSRSHGTGGRTKGVKQRVHRVEIEFLATAESGVLASLVQHRRELGLQRSWLFAQEK